MSKINPETISNKINNITCLEGKNRTQSYRSMIDVLEKILILIK